MKLRADSQHCLNVRNAVCVCVWERWWWLVGASWLWTVFQTDPQLQGFSDAAHTLISSLCRQACCSSFQILLHCLSEPIKRSTQGGCRYSRDLTWQSQLHPVMSNSQILGCQTGLCLETISCLSGYSFIWKKQNKFHVVDFCLLGSRSHPLFVLLVEFIQYPFVMSEISFPSHFSLNTHLSESPVQALLNDFTCTDWTRAWLSKCMHHFLMPHFPDWKTGMDLWLREQGKWFTRDGWFKLREPGFGFGLLVMKPCDGPLPKCNWSLRPFRLSPRFSHLLAQASSICLHENDWEF